MLETKYFLAGRPKLLWRIAAEIKIVEFQPQFCLASHINFEVDMLKIGLDSCLQNPHLKGICAFLHP